PVGVGDRVGQAAGVVVGPGDQAVAARVVVPAGDGGDGHDRRQPLDPGGGRGVGERAVVRLADHAGLAVVPVGDDLVTGGVEALTPAVQPVDRRHRADVVPE